MRLSWLRRWMTIAALSAAWTLVAQTPPTAPIPQDRPRFFELHASFLERAKAGPVDLLFLGDSITYGWNNVPAVWEEFFGKYRPANFGLGSDRIEQVLWRIEHGELDDVKPRVIVLLIGTNNSALHSAEEMTLGIRKIVQRIGEKLPQTKILLLAIFPRGPRSPDATGKLRDDGVTRMRVIDAVNVRLPELADGGRVRVLNLNSVFVGQDGRIPHELMPDQLHLSERGYRLWAEAMQPVLAEMLK